FRPGGWDLCRLGGRHDEHLDERGEHLLHHRRQYADDGVERLHGAGPAHDDDHAEGDGGGERDEQQQRHQRHVHHRTAGGPADLQPGGWDLRRLGGGHAEHHDERGEDLLHHRRQHADDGVERLHRAGPAHDDDHAQGDGGGERDGQQQRHQRHVHHQGGGADVQPGGRQLHRLGDGHAQDHDDRGDDLLHHRRQHADDHAQGDGGGERDGQQQRHQRRLHHQGGGADVQPGGRDVHEHAVRLHLGDDARGDDLLHHRRQHADDGVERVRQPDLGDAHHHAQGYGGGAGHGQQRRDERHLHVA